MGAKSIDLYHVNERDIDIDSQSDVENLVTPDDWVLETCEVFGSGCKLEWVCDGGGYITVSPYPHPNHYIHSVDMSGRTKDIEGIETTIHECIKFMRNNTSCKSIEIKGPDDRYITYTKSLHGKNPMERGDGKVGIHCVNCESDELIVISQELSSSPDERVEISYELICPMCESTMRTEEELEQI